MTRYFTLRVDDVGETTSDEITAYFNKYDYISKYLIFHEISDETHKPHFQGIYQIEDDTIKETKRKNDFNRWFGKSRTSAQKSTAIVKDAEKYSIYISKDHDLRFNNGYSQEEIDSFIERSYKKKKHSKNTDNQKIDYNKILIDEYSDTVRNNITGEIDTYKITDESIIYFLLKKSKAKMKGTNEFIIQNQVNMIKLALYNDLDLMRLAHQLATKLDGKIF